MRSQCCSRKWRAEWKNWTTLTLQVLWSSQGKQVIHYQLCTFARYRAGASLSPMNGRWKWSSVQTRSRCVHSKRPSRTCCPAVSRSRAFPTATSVIAVRRSSFFSLMLSRALLQNARRRPIIWQQLKFMCNAISREGSGQAPAMCKMKSRRSKCTEDVGRCSTAFFFLFFQNKQRSRETV